MMFGLPNTKVMLEAGTVVVARFDCEMVDAPP